MGEMVFAKHLLKGDRRETARLRRCDNEELFGVQIATKVIDEGVRAIEMAQEHGASWADLNCGCPIYEATRRGLGSALLHKPAKLARLVQGLSAGPLPLSVKLRLGPGGDSNFHKVVDALDGLEDGPAFVTLHARTATARYRHPADWDAVEAAANRTRLPVVGNGDVLTHYEADARRRKAPSAHALMIGRGALIKPWIFDELRTNQTWLPTPEERARVYYRLACNFKTHFRDDAKGKQMAWYFFPWHFDFLCRWRPLPDHLFADFPRPLIQSGRDVDELLAAHYEGRDLAPLERLLRCPLEEAHDRIAHCLWDATSADDAVAALQRLASPNNLERWTLAATANSDRNGRDEREGHAPKTTAPKSRSRNHSTTPSAADPDQVCEAPARDVSVVAAA